MEITEIKKVGKGLRYHVYIDDKYEGTFEAEILARYKLKTGQELAREELEKIKIANGDLACFDRGLGALEKSMKTEKMLYDYLVGKAYPEECIERAIEKLKDYGYIDDNVFAENFIRSYSHMKGRKKLKYDLLGKGVAPDIIEDKLNELVSDEEQTEVCLRHAKKYLKNKEFNEKTKQKLYAHLLSKGYDYSCISKVIKEVCDDRD